LKQKKTIEKFFSKIHASPSRRVGLHILAIMSFFLIMLTAQLRVFMELGNVSPPNFGFLTLFPFIFLALGYLTPKKISWILISILGLIFCLILLGDIVYIRYFETIPSIQSQIPLKQAWHVRDSIFALLGLKDFYPLIFMLFLFMGSGGFFFVLYSKGQVARRSLLQYFSPIFIFSALGLFLFRLALVTPIYEKTHHIGRNPVVKPIAHWGKDYSNIDYTRVFGAALFHYNDVVNFFSSKSMARPLSSEEQEGLEQTLIQHADFNEIHTSLFAAAKGFNVMILQLEAFQEFLIDCKVDGIEVTPFLNTLKHDSLYFDKIYDVTFKGRTSDAEFAVNTGLYPDPDYSSAFSHLDKTLVTLPNVLRNIGYSTSSFHAYNKDFWNRTQTHPFYGFEDMFFEKEIEGGKKLGLGTADEDSLTFMVERLKQQTGPFLAYFISLSCHHPYNYSPQGFQDFFKKGESARMAGYLRLAKYTDYALEIFFKKMEEDGLLNNTIFLIFGDHDQGVINPNASQFGQISSLLESIVGVNPFDPIEDKVPLFIYIPGLQNDLQTFKEHFTPPNGSLSDLFPTILHLLGEQSPTGLFGRNLLINNGSKATPLPKAFFPFEKIFSLRAVTERGLVYYDNKNGRHLYQGYTLPGKPELATPQDMESYTNAQNEYLLNMLMIRNNLQKEYRSNKN